jgi:hypothetical protein
MSNELSTVYGICRRIQEGNYGEIDDGTARVIASWYHAGGGSLGYQFVSTGAIPTPSDDLWNDLTDNGKLYQEADSRERLCLNMLGTYLLNRKDRNPVEGWAGLWVSATSEA